jgi:hypothetical protein
MIGTPRAALALRFSLLAALILIGQTAVAQTVWSGLTFSFTKPAFGDPAQPQNQDGLTENVVLTRGSSGGISTMLWRQYTLTGSARPIPSGQRP